MVYHVFNQDKTLLPIKIQEYLWEQIRAVLKVKFTTVTLLNTTCVLFERMLIHNNFKELQSQAPDVFSEIKAIPRWTFIKGALPYVIHCSAAILENRHMLGMTDNLSIPFTKLLSTLHWLLLESFTEVPDSESGLDLNTMELFIQNMIPCMHNLYETDLTFSLQAGLIFWQPLWNHLPPRHSLLALPVVKNNIKLKTSNKSFDSVCPGRSQLQNDSLLIATYFDISLMRVMMLENWTPYGYRWGLLYLQNHLQNILVEQGFDMENCAVLKVINKFTTRKSVSLSFDAQSDPRTSFANIINTGHVESLGIWEQPENKSRVNDKVPESLVCYVNPDGTLRLSFFLDLVKKLVKNKAIYQFSGSLLFVLEQLVEVALDDQHLLKTLINHYPSFLYSQINIIKMFGCEHNCGLGLKGIKGDHFRYLAHEYLKRLLNADPPRAKIWFQKYAENEELDELLQLLHSLFGYCEIVITHPNNTEEPQSKKKLYLHSPTSSDDGEQQQLYYKHKHSNEKMIMEWVAEAVYKKLAQVWKKDRALQDHDFFSTAAHLTKFIQEKYPALFRKLFLSGILESFSKKPKDKKTDYSYFNDSLNSDGSNSNSMSTLKAANGKASDDKRSMFKKKIMTMMHTPSKDIVETSFGSPSEGKSLTLPRGASVTFDTSSIFDTNSLPRDFRDSPLNNSEQQSEARSVNDIKIDGIEKRTRGKTTNMYALYYGVKQLRCLLNLSAPGGVPDETVVAAMLDLEAPVLARAAYLVELAYFVQRCNKDDWPALLLFLQNSSLKGFLYPNMLLTLKHQAGLLFHKWGVAIGKKLDDLLQDDRISLENQGGHQRREKPADLIYQGDRESVSSYCPHSLRFAACQLLKEITAYLRETHATLISLQITDQNDSPLPSHRELKESTSGGRRPKQSIATALSKKIIEVKRRKSSVHLLASTASNSEILKEPSSPNLKYKNKSNGQGLKSKSPKFARRFSRQTSRTPDQTNYGALLVDEQETSEFPWLNVLIIMNKSINFLCVHGSNNCPDSCPIEQIKSCNTLMDALKRVYEPAVLDIENSSTADLNKIFLKKNDNMDPVYKYLCDQVGSFYHVPFSVLCKGAFVMENQQLVDTMAASWEVLLYPDEKLKSAAACLFLVAGLKLEASVANFLTRELTCADAEERSKAVQRFGVLWECQNTVYNHLEDSTKNALKVPVPKLDYTLPSRNIGETPGNFMAPDAPWDPDDQLMNDLDLSDDEVSVYFHDSEKQKELKLKRKTKKLKHLKEQYNLLSVPIVDQASLDSRIQEEDDLVIVQGTTTPQGVQQFFPPAMSHGVLHIIRLLDDTSITTINSQSVSDIAYEMVWKCLVDNPSTFFRRFFEKITKLNKQEELILLLRKLLFHMPQLPGHAAYDLFNNLIGIIAFYDRTNRHGYQERIAEIMPLLWQVVPSVYKIYFADMKQSLRREHLDNVLMVTANVGCTKDIVVLHPGKPKESLSVMDDMTFKELLTQMKSTFEVDAGNYCLVDKHSGMILENASKIRDVYVFKRGFPCPVLKLEELSEDYVMNKRQQQAKTGKVLSINQLKLTMSIFDVLPNKKHVMFLYTELFQQDAFPRRTIDLEFDLCNCPELGKEIVGLDVIFKDSWVKFISNFLERLSELHHFGEDAIGLFLDPINGAILLHCEDVMILRTSIAALINIAKSYGKKFSNDGYYDVLPTIFRVYSQHENNLLVKETLEFAISQFYNLHRSPFLLQMFASVAPMLMTDDMSEISIDEQFDLIPARCLFALLESLERDIPDKLDIMSLVQGEKLRPYDNVLDENDDNKLDLSIRLALTIIAFKSESSRALQMMFVLSAIIPYYLKYLESATEASPTDDQKKNEKRQMKNLIKYVATIIEQNETLVHGYRTEGSINSDHSTDATSNNGVWNKLTNAVTAVRNWFSHAGELIQEGDELERIGIFDEDSENPLMISPTNREEQKSLEDYYQPRTVLLTLASEFTLKCSERYTFLAKEKDGKGKIHNETKFSDIVEEENALILIDVAMSLLKLVFYDHSVLKNPGLQRFVLEAMPSISWAENLEAFTVIVKRINRIFHKCLQKPDYLKFVDWDGLEILMRGIYLTLKKDQYVAGVEEIRVLLHTCTKLMIGDFYTAPFESTTIHGMKSPSSTLFNTTVIKLASKLLSSRPYEYNLQANFSGYVKDSDVTKVERFLVYWLLPLCIRMGTGRYDSPSMSTEDIHFVSTVLTALLSPSKLEKSSVNGPLTLITSISVNLVRKITVTPSMSRICFLGFKILLNVYTDTFGKLWKSLKTAIENYMDAYETDYSLWLFISHIVSNRSPILMHLLPAIRKKVLDLSRFPVSIQHACQRIKKDLINPPVIGSRSLILKQLLNDLTALENSTDLQQEHEELDETDDATDFSLSSPPRGRRTSAEEDDDSYIQRVKTEMRKSGRNSRRMSQKNSIMKSKRSSPQEHSKLRKQVSFQPEDEVTTSLSPPGGSPARSLTSPKRMVMKLSKRSKLRMFKRQSSTDQEDDKETIIMNDSVDDDGKTHLQARSVHDDEENLSDGSQRQLVQDDESRTRRPRAISEPKDPSKVHTVLGDRVADGQMFFTGPSNDTAQATNDTRNSNERLSVVSYSLDADSPEFEVRGRSSTSTSVSSFTLPLSRSPVVRRKEQSSIKIAGVSPSRSRTLTGAGIDRSSLAKSFSSPSDERDRSFSQSRDQLPTSILLSSTVRALSTEETSLSSIEKSRSSDYSPPINVDTVDTVTNICIDDTNKLLSPLNLSVEGLDEQNSPLHSPIRKLSPAMKHKIFIFENSPTGESIHVTPSSASDKEDGAFSAFSDQKTIDDSSEETVSPPRSPRRLPKLPMFDETRFVQMKKKISENHQDPNV